MGAEPPMHGQGPLLPLGGTPPSAGAAHEQLKALGVNAAVPPPGQRRGGLGQGFERRSQGVGRCGQLAALPIDDYARLPVRFVDSMIHDGDIIDLSALVLVH